MIFFFFIDIKIETRSLALVLFSLFSFISKATPQAPSPNSLVPVEELLDGHERLRPGPHRGRLGDGVHLLSLFFFNCRCVTLLCFRVLCWVLVAVCFSRREAMQKAALLLGEPACWSPGFAEFFSSRSTLDEEEKEEGKRKKVKE